MMRVPDRLTGERADKIVANLAGVSRAVARAMFDGGEVLVDGDPVSPKDRLAAGAEVVFPEVGEAPVLEPIEAPLNVVYEDDAIAVIDKAVGMVVHPGAGETGVTLAEAALYRWPQIRGVGDDDRWGIVHRLDRDTSGLMVVALGHDAMAGLKEQFAARRVGRRYVALLDGHLDAPNVTVDAPIGRDPRRPRRMSVIADGRFAVTHFSEQRRWDHPSVTLVEAKLETGRTHQIRVHAASLGSPVWGDGLYGKSIDGQRMFLHAASLEFDHPTNGDRVQLSSPLPDDLESVVAALG